MARSATPRRGRKRLSAEERRHTILEAARQVFGETGDIGGTTTKMIAERAGVSEAIIYRYFDSKEQLYLDAVVEPLRDIIERTVAGIEEYPKTVSEEEKIARARAFHGATLSSMIDCLPLLGLVLFGEPGMAQKFYERCWKPSLDRLSEAWTRHYTEAGLTEYPDTDVAARIVLGACLVYALDAHHGKPLNRTETARLLTDAAVSGVFTLKGW